ncbi:PLP-dependent transferase [Backusella circina FSU 941]|nr:PLP-dependent transferase [Backusella circina FSU 941]
MQLKSDRKFGKEFLKDFFLEEGYTALNHGSFGVYPKVLQSSLIDFQMKTELNPDRWLRRDMFLELDKNREALSGLLHCDSEELVFIPNAMTGINTVLRSLPFETGDKVICFNTAYMSVGGTLRFIKDYQKLELVVIDLEYPMSDDEVLEKTKETIELHNHNGKVKACVFDAISSAPGVRFPYERMTHLLRENNILSVLDGAHAIGQLPLDLHETDPDFFITNCHKWLYTPRGAAVLYVPFRNQKLVHPAIINSWYGKKRDPSVKETSFRKEFEWPGTADFSTFMCIIPGKVWKEESKILIVMSLAMEYRKSLGGEDAIMKYCNELAVKGGQLVADIWGTSVMENDEKTLTTAMVNVEVPLGKTTLSESVLYEAFIDKLLYEHHTMATVYKHNQKWYARISAQIYNELDDFKVLADALLKVCRDLEAQ